MNYYLDDKGSEFMRLKDYRNNSWDMLKENGNYWSLFGLTLGVLMIGAIPGFGLFIGGTALVGLSIVYFKTFREKELNLTLVMDPFTKERFVNSFVAYLLKNVFIFLWALLFIIPGIVKAYSYAMTSFILADNPEMKSLDALEESKKMMDGKKGRLFLLDLSFIGWIILGILTFGIGLFFLAPYIYGARVQFYLNLVKKTETVEVIEA